MLVAMLQQSRRLLEFTQNFSSMAVDVASGLTSKLKLNDGTYMPWFGIGTYQSESGGQCEKTVEFALRSNYRMIDTAQAYHNEGAVGRAIASSGVPREEIFIVTKLNSRNKGYTECKESLSDSLKKLGTDYVDLFLIHSPRGGKVVPSYKAMMELKDKGLTKSIGVSNFGIEHLNNILKTDLPVPSVNQIELHPYCRYEEVVELCRLNGVAVMGYSPLARAEFLTDPTIKEIGQKYKKTAAHVLLRWSIQSGFITIPKSDHQDRILANRDIFDFSLSDSDMAILNSQPRVYVTTNRLDAPWEG